MKLPEGVRSQGEGLWIISESKEHADAILNGTMLTGHGVFNIPLSVAVQEAEDYDCLLLTHRPTLTKAEVQLLHHVTSLGISIASSPKSYAGILFMELSDAVEFSPHEYERSLVNPLLAKIVSWNDVQIMSVVHSCRMYDALRSEHGHSAELLRACFKIEEERDDSQN